MKVKVGDTIYDGDKEPVMVILSDTDKDNIAKMDSDNTKYCCFPNVPEWMTGNYQRLQVWMND